MRGRPGGVEGLQMPRTIFPIAAWALSLGCIVGWGSFVMPSSTFLPKAGPAGTAIAFAIGMLAMLVVACNYSFVARHCSEDGGIYAYARAAFGPNHAFICSWCLVLSYFSSIVSNATALALVIRSVYGPVLQVGFHYVVAGYDVYLGEVASALVAVVFTAWVCIRSSRLTSVIETVLVVGMTLGVGAILVLMLTSPQVRLASALPAFSPEHTPLAGTLMVVATVPWAYIGFEAVSQVSGECNLSARRFLHVMMLAIVLGTIMYLTLNTITAAVIPEGYESWASYLEDLPNLTGALAIPSFHAGYRLAGRAGMLLFGATALCAVMSGVVGFFVAASRLIYFMAQDGALNKRYTHLHEQYRTPVVALTVLLGVALAMPFVGRNVLNWIVDLMSLGALVAYLYTSLATVKFARAEGRRRSAWLGICGTTISVLCLMLLVIPIPELGTSLSQESFIILFAWMALGVNFFTPTLVRQ